jgi:hypothetical protein
MPQRTHFHHSQAGRRLVQLALGVSSMIGVCGGQTLYDFGNPNAEEQQYIEHINRARAFPAAEGAKFASTTDPGALFNYGYWPVDLAMMQTEFNALAAQPPLAPNAKLMTISRNHSSWMLANGTQAHDETNPTKTFANRLSDIGYPVAAAGENINAFAQNPWNGHIALDVDWGNGASGRVGGMQNPRGHRLNIHSASYREIGVGVVNGSNAGPSGTVGPQLVTQDFGTQPSSPTFGTGVVYYDLNANDAFDAGEGIGGLTVNVSGASYYCTSATGGGWTVPIPTTAATRTVSFTGLNVSQSINLVVPASTNAKADLKLTYTPPAITSDPAVIGGTAQTVSFNPVPGSTGYVWSRSLPTAAAAENCESTGNVTISKSGTYSVLNSNVKQQGTYAFHLENTTNSNQSIQLNTLFHGGGAPSLSFQSLVRYATTAERFRVQVREEGAFDWQDVYLQSGTGTSGEAGFNARNVDLSVVANKSFRVRFLLSSHGSNYTTSGDIVGWFIDAINFTNVSQLNSTVTESLSTTSGTFTPASGSTYLMSVAPVISGRSFPAAYQTLTATAGVLVPPVITSQPVSTAIASGNSAVFSVAASGGGLSYQWFAGTSGNTSNPVSGAIGLSFTTPALTASASYWVRVTNSAGSVDSATATATVMNPPAIVTHPSSGSIASGSSTILSVSASGSSLGYQWYAGSSGTTTNPIAGATGSTFTTPNLTTSASYWVRVFNTVGSTNSNTATATVVQPPVITTQPASVTVNSGGTAAFSVTASGGGLSYQWYSGNSGNLSNPIAGATSGSFTSPALTSTASYWVRVSNIAGAAISNTATVTVTYPPVILSQPVSTTITKGSTATISVVASGPSLTYQWYQGSSGTTNSPVSGATSSSFTTPVINNGSKTYWVRVSNGAGSANSVTSLISTQNGAVTRNFSVWASEIETANSIPAGTLSNATGDHDKDGRTNLIEYAFGASPIIANDAAPRMPVMQSNATECFLQYQIDTTLTDITVTPVASTDLNQWRAPGVSGAPAGFANTLVSTSGNVQTRKAAVPKSSAPRCLLRIQVTRP